MKKFIQIIILTLSLSAVFTGCQAPVTEGTTSTVKVDESNKNQTINEAVENAFTAYQNQNFEVFNTYLTDLPTTLDHANSTKSAASIKAHTEFEYTIIDYTELSSVLGVVNVELKTMTLEELLALYMSETAYLYNDLEDELLAENPDLDLETYELTEEQSELLKDRANAIFDEMLLAEDRPMVTITFPIRMENINGKWLLYPSEELMTALTNLSIGLTPEMRESMVLHFESREDDAIDVETGVTE